MSMEHIDKVALKTLIKEILKEDISLFKEVIREILAENQIITTAEQAERRKKLERLIDEDFDKYDKVFKALA